MRAIIRNILSIGLDPKKSEISKFGERVFNLDCYIAILGISMICIAHYPDAKFNEYLVAALAGFLVNGSVLFLHLKKHFNSAAIIFITYHFVLIVLNTYITRFPIIALYLIPLGISCFIYFGEKEKYAVPFLIFFSTMGVLLSLASTYFPNPNQVVENPTVRLVSISLFFVTTLYKVMTLVLQHRIALDNNNANKFNLKISEKRYRSQFENNLLGMIVFGEELNLIDVNPAFCKMVGYTKDQLIQHSDLKDWFKGSLNDQENFEKLLKGEIQQFSCNKTFMKKGIEPFHTTTFISGTYDDNGVLKYLNCSVLDVTEKKEQEEIIQKTLLELNKKNIDLEKYIESNGQLENFAYMASHDLKAPLRTITSYSQLLARRTKGKLDETDLEFFDFIVGASKNMSNLIENLLNYSKANSQKKNFEEMNVSNMLEVITHELKADIDEKEVAITFDQVPTSIVADQTRLKQLFQNMISNAIKFMEKGKTPQILIGCEDRESHFEFFIQDNGIGIKPEFHEKIFMLFRKLHGSGEFEGTGIGLALCKKIVEQHGGEIWVESTYGEGTTFFFTIDKNLNNENKVNTLEKEATHSEVNSPFALN